MTKQAYMVGLIYLFLTAGCWSFVAVTVKTLTQHVDPYTITFYRMFLASLVFTAIFVMRRGQWLRLPWLLPWILVGTLGRTGNYLLYNAGLVHAPSQAATILAPAQQIGVILFAWWFLGEKIKFRWLGLSLSLVGLLLIWWNGQPLAALLDTSYLWGYLLLILAGLATAVHFTSQKILSDRFSGLEILLPVFMLSAVASWPFAWAWGGFSQAYTPLTWTLLLLLGLLLTGMSYLFLAEGYRRCDATTGVVIINSGVLLTLVWSYSLLHETISPIMIAGALLGLTGTIAVILADRRHLAPRAVASTERTTSRVRLFTRT